jgi:hypothetical protein
MFPPIVPDVALHDMIAGDAQAVGLSNQTTLDQKRQRRPKPLMDNRASCR